MTPSSPEPTDTVEVNITDTPERFAGWPARPGKGLFGYRIASQPGEPCRSFYGHIYFRDKRDSPIIRLTHKEHVLKKARAGAKKLSRRQQIKMIAREAIARTIADRLEKEAKVKERVKALMAPEKKTDG